MCPASDDPAQGDAVEADFQRIKRLPPYVFNIVGELKMAARARGEDIIDFGMGNPDQPTPKHIVDQLTETAQRGDTHRYSQSKGIPRLRKAITDWYQRRYDVSLDPETWVISNAMEGSLTNYKQVTVKVGLPGATDSVRLDAIIAADVSQYGDLTILPFGE